MEDNIYIPEIDYLHSISFLMTFPNCYFDIYLFLFETQVYRKKERQRDKSSICWFPS